MADRVLVGLFHFAEGFAVPIGQEHRIVTKSAIPPRRPALGTFGEDSSVVASLPALRDGEEQVPALVAQSSQK